MTQNDDAITHPANAILVVSICNLHPVSLVRDWNPHPPLGLPRRRIPRTKRHPMGNNRPLHQHTRLNPIPHHPRKPTSRRTIRQTHNQNMPKMRTSPHPRSKILPKMRKTTRIMKTKNFSWFFTE